MDDVITVVGTDMVEVGFGDHRRVITFPNDYTARIDYPVLSEFMKLTPGEINGFLAGQVRAVAASVIKRHAAMWAEVERELALCSSNFPCDEPAGPSGLCAAHLLGKD